MEWLVERRLSDKKRRPSPGIKSFLLIGTYQLLFLQGVPDHAAINETVEAVKQAGFARAAKMVNAILRRITRERGGIMGMEIPLLPLHLRYAHPKWMVERWLDRLGPGDTEALLGANNERPPLTLRVNTLVMGRDEFLDILRRQGIHGRPGRLAPEAVIIDQRLDPRLIPGFEEGLFYVQDEAFQLVTHLLDVKPGERVLDACAGVGGKSTHIIQLMKGVGELWAFEPNRQRRELLMENLDKQATGALVEMVVPGAGDVLQATREGGIGLFDRILVDAPCSGLGVIRRHPDIKWNRSIEDIVGLAKRQFELIKGVIGALRPGGRLIYSTCTNEPEETVGVVEQVLKEIASCRLVPLEELEFAQGLPAAMKGLGHYVSGHPPETDGFFAAAFTRP